MSEFADDQPGFFRRFVYKLRAVFAGEKSAQLYDQSIVAAQKLDLINSGQLKLQSDMAGLSYQVESLKQKFSSFTDRENERDKTTGGRIR